MDLPTSLVVGHIRLLLFTLEEASAISTTRGLPSMMILIQRTIVSSLLHRFHFRSAAGVMTV
jgi:hypothetical protein